MRPTGYGCTDLSLTEASGDRVSDGSDGVDAVRSRIQDSARASSAPWVRVTVPDDHMMTKVYYNRGLVSMPNPAHTQPPRGSIDLQRLPQPSPPIHHPPVATTIAAPSHLTRTQSSSAAPTPHRPTASYHRHHPPPPLSHQKTSPLRGHPSSENPTNPSTRRLVTIAHLTTMEAIHRCELLCPMRTSPTASVC